MADVKWIKVTTDVFDDEKILLIESLPEADSIIVIWFKLLCLAGKQNNSGVFVMSNGIPYTDSMLATIFRRKESTVQLALQTFERFGMIEVIDDAITIPNWGKHQNFDKIEKNNEYMKEYMREYRAKQKAISCKTNSKTNSKVNVSGLDKNREEKSREEENRVNKTPSVYYPADACLNQAFLDYIEMRKKIKKPLATDRAISLAMSNLEKLSKGDNDVAIQILEQSIMNSWQGLFPLKQEVKKQSETSDYIDRWRDA